MRREIINRRRFLGLGLAGSGAAALACSLPVRASGHYTAYCELMRRCFPDVKAGDPVLRGFYEDLQVRPGDLNAAPAAHQDTLMVQEFFTRTNYTDYRTGQAGRLHLISNEKDRHDDEV